MQIFTSSFGDSKLETRYELMEKETKIVKPKYFYPMLEIKTLGRSQMLQRKASGKTVDNVQETFMVH